MYKHDLVLHIANHGIINKHCKYALIWVVAPACAPIGLEMAAI